jgi:hypothetical protein
MNDILGRDCNPLKKRKREGIATWIVEDAYLKQ